MFIPKPANAVAHRINYNLFREVLDFCVILNRHHVSMDHAFALARCLGKQKALTIDLKGIYDALSEDGIQFPGFQNQVTRMLNFIHEREVSHHQLPNYLCAFVFDCFACVMTDLISTDTHLLFVRFLIQFLDACTLMGARRLDFGLDLAAGLARRYRIDFEDHGEISEERIPIYSPQASWNRSEDQDGQDLFFGQVDFYAGNLTLPPKIAIILNWAFRVQRDTNGNFFFLPQPALIFQLLGTPVQHIFILLRLPPFYLQFLGEENVTSSEFEILILNRDSGLGTFHNPLAFTRPAWNAFLQFVAECFSACLNQTFYIHHAGEISPHIFPSVQDGNMSGRVVVLWLNALQASQRHPGAGDLSFDLHRQFLSIHKAGALIFDVELRRLFFITSTLYGVVDYLHEALRTANGQNLITLFSAPTPPPHVPPPPPTPPPASPPTPPPPSRKRESSSLIRHSARDKQRKICKFC
ncbi:hypothetical protein Fcan01_24458 [Folsomia candida]|uniref:Uncharacterized protein n=1 Tax=Folsomia candida TaxID=158441 RepID=A0A226D7U4_FOLCA|nr:hypothetical protein Fcan01_24458 [Folsomia candida]